jgi:TetR/AcrR family transcriptional repressor of nem operon
MASGARDGRFALTRTPALEADCFIAMVHGAMLAARATGDWTAFGSVTRSALAGLVKRD